MPESTDDRSDAELISATQTGDHTAFGVLVGRYQRAAIRVAVVALGSPSDADDVAQEAFMKAHGAIDRFRVGEPFPPWLYRIVTNTARNRTRRQHRQDVLAVRAGALAVAPGQSPDEAVVHREDRCVVMAAINRLSREDRLVLLYRWYEELSEAEIAEALSCRRGTVKSKLSRAMGRLRTELSGA